MADRPGLNGFLAGCRTRLAGAGRVQAVLGSEAGDLDSIAGAVVLGWLRERAGRDPGRLHLPLLDMEPGDLRLRPEAQELFAAAGLDPSPLLYAPEVDLAGLWKAGRLSLALVDHNELALRRAELGPAVEEIVDHHPDRGLYPWARVRLVEPVGSAATLVARLLLAEAPGLLDRTVAALLLGPILLDTGNLAPGGRARAADRRAAGRLRAAAGPAAEGLFARLAAARFRPLPLDAADHLRRDLKLGAAGGVRFGISTVYRDLDGWLAEEPALPDRLRDFARGRSLDLLLVLLAFTPAGAGAPGSADAPLRRELVLHAREPALVRAAAVFLESRPLGLRPRPAGTSAAIGGPAAEDLRVWSQGRWKVSRKVLRPLLEEFLSDRRPPDGRNLH